MRGFVLLLENGFVMNRIEEFNNFFISNEQDECVGLVNFSA